MIELKPIGVVHTEAAEVPNSWSVSEVEGELVIEREYIRGMRDIRPGERIVVIFHFHRSRPFTPEDLTQHPRGDPSRPEKGVFSICSPFRPNPIGMSVLTVTAVRENIISVKGLDMIDSTPILDIKPQR
jgi:tRNA-Thr(GGU) m(6)t(6)A37 methyltransferase TsaA